uniref:Uncharacterized protein n=1 Tax=Aegilops tauschii subsp. strangulata TaxID=200361 RepID=A0A453PRN8_AEGTS
RNCKRKCYLSYQETEPNRVTSPQSERLVEEETGIKLNLESTVDLTALLDPATGWRMLPSPGGYDEEIGMFLYRGARGRGDY